MAEPIPVLMSINYTNVVVIIFAPDCPQLQHANSRGHGGRGGDGRGENGNGRVNGDRGGGRNCDSTNITRDSRDGNRKPPASLKYIHPVDAKYTVVDISGYNLEVPQKVCLLCYGKGMGFIIAPMLFLNITLTLPKQTQLSTNMMTIPHLKATLIHLQIVPATAKGRN